MGATGPANACASIEVKVTCLSQTYLSMLCSFRWGLFLFFAAMCVIMTATVYGFYPETKGLGIEETPAIFKKHWWVQALNSHA